MMQRGRERVLNASSDAARVGSSLESVYAGANATVIGLTKSLAREVATSGLTAKDGCRYRPAGGVRTEACDGPAMPRLTGIRRR